MMGSHFFKACLKTTVLINSAVVYLNQVDILGL